MGRFAVDATIAFAVVFVVGQQVIGSIAYLRGSREPYVDKMHVRVSELTFRVVGYLFLGLYASNPVFQRPFTWDPLPVRLIGVPLMVAGLVIALVGHHELGEFWVPGIAVYRNHKLVSGGLYRRTRHPMYFGLSLGFLGIAVLGASKATSVAAACLALAVLTRIPLEEAMLRRYFYPRNQLAAYLTYLDAVPILIPFLHFRLRPPTPHRQPPRVSTGVGPSQRPPAKKRRKRRKKKHRR